MTNELSLDLEPDSGAAAKAREEVRSAFGDRVPASLLHDLTVVISELVSNSVAHGPGETIQLRLKIADDGTVRGEVEDQGTGRVAIREMAEDEGIGLRVVDWLTDRWAVYEGSTHVWFEMGAKQPGEDEPGDPVEPV